MTLKNDSQNLFYQLDIKIIKKWYKKSQKEKNIKNFLQKTKKPKYQLTKLQNLKEGNNI